MELKEYIGKKIKYLRISHGYTQQELADKLHTTKQTVSRYEKGLRSADQDILFELCEIFKVSINEFFPPQVEHKSESTENNDILHSIISTSTQLEPPRQTNVLTYAQNQLDEQNNSIVKEETELYEVKVVESLAAGTGYSYSEYNEVYSAYTSRNDLKRFDIASYVSGDSMEPYYSNGDVVLIQKGYDNQQGAVYAIDYDGKSYLKRVYNDGDKFRLVSYNSKYEPIYIDVPVDESIYFNIVGRVVDSFTPEGI